MPLSSQVHTKPRRPLIFQSSQGAAASRRTQQHSSTTAAVQHAAAAVQAVAFVAATVLCVCAGRTARS